ncbi:MAG: DUF502 domain-containing protein [Planctomycetota bacterium]
MAKKKFASDFKRFFLRGLAALLPTLLTVAILLYVFGIVRRYIGTFVDAGMYWAIEHTRLGNFLSAQTWDRYFSWWVYSVLALVMVYLFGRFLASFLGRGIWRMVEGAIVRLPLIKQIYPSVKQVTDFLFSEPRLEFSRVVAVEYPRKGVWSLGLVTGTGMRTISEAAGDDLVTIFIPSSPTPVTGYTITVRRNEIVDLPLTIDEALRFTISGGLIRPPGQLAKDIGKTLEPKSLPPAGQPQQKDRENST